MDRQDNEKDRMEIFILSILFIYVNLTYLDQVIWKKIEDIVFIPH